MVMEPPCSNRLEGVLPGTQCIANAYTNDHELIAPGELACGESLYLHMTDAHGLVHAAILRVQALILPAKLLVLSNHYQAWTQV